MGEQSAYDVVIIGGGPAGLSAAARAHQQNLNYLLFEKDRLANTIDYYYQKGKFVMALPANIPLRSDLEFAAGSRDSVLRRWKQQAGDLQLRHRHEDVREVSKRADGGFDVTTSQQTYVARHVIVAMGKKGNPNKLNKPGEALPHVSDRLVDPGAFEGKNILVVGGGDAAAEVAMALSDQNQVYMSYHRSALNPDSMNESLRGKVEEKLARGMIDMIFDSAVKQIKANEVELNLMGPPERGGSERPILGTRRLAIDQVFTMIGAKTPSAFLTKCGVRFRAAPETDRKALPLISERYEAEGVEGLYIIGALTGKDLIKHAMNQGFEVIQSICGETVEPIDEAGLQKTLQDIPGDSAEAKIKTMTSRIPVWATASAGPLRDLLLVSTVHHVAPGEVIFEKGSYSTTFYTIFEGEVEIDVPGPEKVRLTQGDFFGEMSLLSDVPRSTAARAATSTILIETPRNAMLKLISAEPETKAFIDRRWVSRALRMYLAPNQPASVFETLSPRVEWQAFKRHEVVFHEGDPGDAIYIIRNGVVKISTVDTAGNEVVISNRSVGDYIGEMAVLNDDIDVRTATATAVNAVEVMHIPRDDIAEFAQSNPWLIDRIREQTGQRSVETALVRESPRSTAVLGDMSRYGVVESTDVLLIDETKCIRCDNCVNACAATHNGQSRLDRKHGPSFAYVHVPVACRHCVGAPCLADCPPGDAILRDEEGVVRINESTCIGCGNCANYCPYGVIFMVEPPEPAWWQRWFGPRSKAEVPAEAVTPVVQPQDSAGPCGCETCGAYDYPQTAEHREIAIKCDMCQTLSGGPACVSSCPTGAAIRVKQHELPVIDFSLRMRK
ncbi:cyclic nucleotide-binding domain-containing protein [Candidatus Entotheonella palauensis]|uniref:cyclic nucleotide-binding domain-containing protein n=1 Tax=Candidatus Entotheonella palauensis TaxID=93172 RepID=UPI000B7E1DB6|nr:cyclic nucleotide-binding domain-containing protein [Candidatus Entotheonella palauensis]